MTIIAPDRVNFGVQFVDSPNAEQHVVQATNGGGVRLLVVGGLTKRQEIASRIAGQLAAAHLKVFRTLDGDETPKDVAGFSVLIADAILALTETKEKDDHHRDEAPE